MLSFKQDLDGSLFNLMVKKLGDGEPYSTLVCFGVYDGDKLLAIINYHSYNGYDVYMDIYTFSVKWASKRILKECFRIPFEDFKTRRITACTSRANKKARQFLERLGFKLEGVMKKARFDKADCFIYGMLKMNCKWLEKDTKWVEAQKK